MTVPEKCDVCLTRHHKHQAHVFAKAVTVPIKTVSRHVVAVEASADPSWVERKCVVCGAVFDTKRRHAETCSSKCRQRKRRAKP